MNSNVKKWFLVLSIVVSVIIISCLIAIVIISIEATKPPKGRVNSSLLYEPSTQKRYIVRFKKNIDANVCGTSKCFLKKAYPGVILECTSSQAEQLCSRREILYIVEDTPVKKSGLNWHLRASGMNDLPRSKNVNTKILIFDTGIDGYNASLNIERGYNSITRSENKSDWTDTNGHGTSIAGICASNRNGICPDASLWAIKVLDLEGNGWASAVVQGIDWALEMCEGLNIPIVANLSLTGPHNMAMDEACKRMVHSGITVITAAGNHGTDVESYSPAHLDDVITVGSYNENRTFSKFSNYGKKVDILAPGEKIYTMELEGKYNFMDGTSASSAIVAGVVALLLNDVPNLNPEQVKKELVDSAKRRESFTRIQVDPLLNTTNLSVWCGYW